MSDHAERLRHMAAGWLQSARDEEQLNAGLNLHSGAMIATKQSIAHYRAQAAALLAGAEALERYDEAKGVLRQIASGQSWNPQRDAEEALARLEGK